MFATAPIRLSGPYMHTTEYVDRFSFEGSRVQAEYAPDGAVADAPANCGCRLTRLGAQTTTESVVDEFHTETLWRGVGSDPERPTHTDWVTTETEQTNVDGARRSVHVRQQPVLDGARELSEDRPVAEYAFAIQSLRWGTLEVYVYLGPTYQTSRARPLALSVADQVTGLVQQWPAPDARRSKA